MKELCLREQSCVVFHNTSCLHVVLKTEPPLGTQSHDMSKLYKALRTLRCSGQPTTWKHKTCMGTQHAVNCCALLSVVPPLGIRPKWNTCCGLPLVEVPSTFVHATSECIPAYERSQPAAPKMKCWSPKKQNSSLMMHSRLLTQHALT